MFPHSRPRWVVLSVARGTHPTYLGIPNQNSGHKRVWACVPNRLSLPFGTLILCTVFFFSSQEKTKKKLGLPRPLEPSTDRANRYQFISSLQHRTPSMARANLPPPPQPTGPFLNHHHSQRHHHHQLNTNQFNRDITEKANLSPPPPRGVRLARTVLASV